MLKTLVIDLSPALSQVITSASAVIQILAKPYKHKIQQKEFTLQIRLSIENDLFQLDFFSVTLN
jgi:hypothetical protein